MLNAFKRLMYRLGWIKPQVSPLPWPDGSTQALLYKNTQDPDSPYRTLCFQMEDGKLMISQIGGGLVEYVIPEGWELVYRSIRFTDLIITTAQIQ